MRLNATTIRTLSLPAGTADKVFFDEDLPGFGLRVRTSGAQTWMVQYAIAGKTRRMVLGSTAAVDPGKARATAKDLLAAVRLGRDPASEKAEVRAKAAETFGALLARFMERQRARLKRRSYEEVERHLLMHAKPLHTRPIEAIDRRAIASHLAEIARTSGPAASNRVRASLSAYFSWAAREGFIEANCVGYTNKAVENGARHRVLADDELATIWRCLGDDQYGALVKLLMLTGARRDEIASVTWSEFDLEAGTIMLSPERTKSRREHIIPLSELALAILSAQPRRNEANGVQRELIFGYGRRGYQDWSGSKADLDVRIAAALSGKALDWRLHDFRRSISTTLHERFGVQPHVVEAVLGHVGGHQGGIAGVYNKALYLDERRRALARWADHVQTIIIGNKSPARIVRLRGQK